VRRFISSVSFCANGKTVSLPLITDTGAALTLQSLSSFCFTTTQHTH
jgi:hypothetical protein